VTVLVAWHDDKKGRSLLYEVPFDSPAGERSVRGDEGLTPSDFGCSSGVYEVEKRSSRSVEVSPCRAARSRWWDQRLMLRIASRSSWWRRSSSLGTPSCSVSLRAVTIS
jgi:hypothetical protein